MKPRDIQYVKYIVHKYLRSKPELSEFADDLEQEGSLAWLEATTQWDPSRGAMDKKLYIAYRVAQALMNYINRTERRHFRKPEADPESPFWQLEEPTPVESIRDDTEDVRNELRELLSDVRFTPAQNNVLRLYFEGHNGAEIARELGVTRERIRQILGEVHEKIRKSNDLADP